MTRRPPILLFAVAALAAAGIAAFLLAGRDSRGSGSPGIERDTVVRVAQGDRGGDTVELEDVRMGAEAGAAQRSTVPSVRQSASPGRTVKPKRVAPDGPYRGRILDHLGRPLENVDVELQPWEEANELNIRAGRGFGQAAPLQLEATTDEDGRFVVERVKPIGLTIGVTAVARGYLRTPMKHVLAADGSGDLGDIHLEPGVVVTGWVRETNGRAVEGARVRRIERDGDAMVDVLDQIGFSKVLDLVTTDEDGRFELAHEAAGQIVLLVESDDILPQRYEGPTKRGGDVHEDIVIEIERAGRIVGRVRGYPRGRLRGTVAAAALDPATDLKAKSGMSAIMSAQMSPAGEHTGMIQGDGTFTIEGLTPGARYEVRGVERRMFVEVVSLTDSTEATADGGSVTLRFDPGASVRFRAVDARTKQPVERLAVNARWSDRSARTMLTPVGDDPPRRFEGGEVTLHELRPRTDPEPLTVVVDAPGYLRATLGPVLVDEEGVLDAGTVELEPAPRYRFRVIDAATRKPIRRAKVTLEAGAADAGGREALRQRMRMGGAPPKEWAKTDEDGRCSIPGIAAETISLRVRARDYANYAIGAFTPTSPDAETLVELSRGGSIQVVAVDSKGHAIAGVRAECRTSRGESTSTAGKLTDDTGAALFEALPTGTHEVRALRSTTPGFGRISDAEEDEWLEVRIDRDEVVTVEFELPAAGALRGVVTMGGDPVVGARVTLVDAENSAAVERMIAAQDEFRGFGSDRTSDTTSSDGSFEIAEIELGEYVLIARHADAAMPTTEDVEIVDGVVTLDVEILPTAVVGRVVDDSGDPIVGADVSVRRHEGGGDRRQRLTRAYLGSLTSMARTDGDGRFRVIGVRANTELEVLVRARGYTDAATKPMTVASRETRDVGRIELERSGSILVSILGDELESRILFVIAEPADEEAVANEKLELVRAGRARIDGLAPGLWRVTTRGSRRGQRAEDGGEPIEEVGPTVEVKSGETATVELER